MLYFLILLIQQEYIQSVENMQKIMGLYIKENKRLKMNLLEKLKR